MSALDITEAVLERMDEIDSRGAKEVRSLGVVVETNPSLLVRQMSPVLFTVGTRSVVVSLNQGLFRVSAFRSGKRYETPSAVTTRDPDEAIALAAIRLIEAAGAQ